MTATEPPTFQAALPRTVRLLGSLALLGLIASFVSTIQTFTAIEQSATPATGGTPSEVARLFGADVELGYPASIVASLLFIIVLCVSAAALAGARIARGWFVTVVCVVTIGIVFEIWVSYLVFSWLAIAQLLIFAAALVVAIRWMPGGRPASLGVFLVVASIVGFFAAFRLTVDKVGTFINPTIAPSCDFSVLVQCGTNLRSWQGSIFGFPNPLIGIGGWMTVLIIGIMVLSGLTFARWFWIAVNLGVLFAVSFIGWLIYQSIFSLATLCPWCMVTWVVVIPTFWIVTLHNLKSGVFRVAPQAQRFFAAAYTYVPLITLVSYLLVAGIAQARLNLLQYI